MPALARQAAKPLENEHPSSISAEWPKAIGGLGDFRTGLPGSNSVAIATAGGDVVPAYFFRPNMALR